MSRPVDEWKFDRDAFAKSAFSLGDVRPFFWNRAPQIFVIWIAAAILLRSTWFVGAFGSFARHFNSPFFHVAPVARYQPVDITALFLIGVSGFASLSIFITFLLGCFGVCRILKWRRPAALESRLALFSRRLTDELSSSLTHVAAATMAMLMDRGAAIGVGMSIGTVFFALVALVFAATIYRVE